MIVGTACIDLVATSHYEQRHLTYNLRAAPTGFRVQVTVGARLPYDTAGDVFSFLVDAVTSKSLSLDFHGDQDNVMAWVSAVRDAVQQRLSGNLT